VVVMVIAYIPWIGVASVPNDVGSNHEELQFSPKGKHTLQANVDIQDIVPDLHLDPLSLPPAVSQPLPAVAEIAVAPPPRPVLVAEEAEVVRSPGLSALVTDTAAAPDLSLSEDPFAAGNGGGKSPSAGLSSAAMMAMMATKSKVRPNAEEVDASFEGLDPLLAKINGIDILKEVGIPIPKQAFQYDESEEAKAKRGEEKVAEIVAQGMPEAVARLQAQLFERELLNKQNRAKHNRKRAIVRLIQEARLKKDAEDRDQRLLLLKMKQEDTARMMAEADEDRKQNEAEKDKDRKNRDEKVAADRKRSDAEKDMLTKIRMEEVTKQNAENEERRKQEKEDKREEIKTREARDNTEKETKRKMMEEFRNAMAAQMDDQKRLAREERLAEAQEARESRLKLEEDMGIKKKPMDALAEAE
jgi:hypothetical protein